MRSPSSCSRNTVAHARSALPISVPPKPSGISSGRRNGSAQSKADTSSVSGTQCR